MRRSTPKLAAVAPMANAAVPVVGSNARRSGEHQRNVCDLFLGFTPAVVTRGGEVISRGARPE